MRSKQLQLITAVLTCLVFIGCGKTVETYSSAPLSDYIPLQPGKYITYRLDSMVFTNFGSVTVFKSFQEKHLVDSKFTDATGRDSYRIFRFTRDTAGTQPWVSAGTYVITPTEKVVEVVENNLRFVKLALPIKQGFSWKGNQYLVDWHSSNDSLSLYDQPFSSLYSFSNDDDMKDWDYTYTATNMSLMINGQRYNDGIEVTAAHEVFVPDTVNAINNKAQIPDSSKTVYLRGTASDTIIITAQPPKSPVILYVYNRSNAPAKLGSIDIPVNGGKAFEYVNNNWTYGYKNPYGVREDKLYTDLPYGYKNIMIDRYAKNIGLVDQEFVMWEYQYSNSLQSGYFQGFGIKRSIIDHN